MAGGKSQRVDDFVGPLTDCVLFNRERDRVDEDPLAINVQDSDSVGDSGDVVTASLLGGAGPRQRLSSIAHRNVEIGRERPIQIETILPADSDGHGRRCLAPWNGDERLSEFGDRLTGRLPTVSPAARVRWDSPRIPE